MGVSSGQLLTVPQGTVVLEAADPESSKPVAINSPLAQFYVLRDDVALQGSDIVSPRPATDQTGSADVELSLTSGGQKEFSRVTKEIAQLRDGALTVGLVAH